MPGFISDVMVKNLVMNDDAIRELHDVFLRRVNAHNEKTSDVERKLTPTYIVRFDNRGYRSFSVDEAWAYFKNADKVERLVLRADCPAGISTHQLEGEQLEVRLDADHQSISHIIVGGESRDWVETTFAALEVALNRNKSLATSIFRTEWMALVVQLIGVFFGLLLCLWLATLSAPYLTTVEYPRALSFAFWFLVYSNLWGYIQHRAIAAISVLFPNVRFSREGGHWTQAVIRKGLEIAGVAFFIWALSWITSWAASIIAPFMTTSF